YNGFTSKTRSNRSRCNKRKLQKAWRLHDESESDSSSGSEVHYDITSSDESPVVTTREKSKAQEVVVATTSPPRSDEGCDEVNSWLEPYGYLREGK
ncbi:hypothetical protein HAX54_008013, partial [Datura stramonium]|nr:hypothetical protein [Datura stramonium]